MDGQTPKCIGVIMDGNRRWATKRGDPSLNGHKQGYEKLKEFLGWAKERGVENVIVYAFSRENWKRTEAEIGYLMDLFRLAIREDLAKIAEETSVRFLGDISMLDAGLRKDIEKIEQKSSVHKGGTVAIALSYGGRDEIIRAFKRTEISGASPTEEDFSRFLDTAGMPDPDIIIRTGGEFRLSGFLPWQSVYSELFFTETLWPDLSRREFEDILAEYVRRKRNFGK